MGGAGCLREVQEGVDARQVRGVMEVGQSAAGVWGAGNCRGCEVCRERQGVAGGVEVAQEVVP